MDLIDVIASSQMPSLLEVVRNVTEKCSADDNEREVLGFVRDGLPALENLAENMDSKRLRDLSKRFRRAIAVTDATS